MACSGDSRNRSFSGQTTLPLLPLPTLDETLNRFSRSVSALLPGGARSSNMCGGGASKQERVDAIIKEFREGDGPVLQKHLESSQRALLASAEENKDFAINSEWKSYVEEFWSDAYLVPDDSIVINSNPYFLLEDGPDPKTSSSQTLRAAALVFASLKFASLLKQNELAPDEFRGNRMCMGQYKKLFGGARIPSADDAPGEQRRRRDVFESDETSTHVVVLAGGGREMFYFRGLWNGDADGGAGPFDVAVSEAEIAEILQNILSNCTGSGSAGTGGGAADHEKASGAPGGRSSKKSHPIGVLTTLPRSDWANARNALRTHSGKNDRALKIIDSALFVLVLDDYRPGTADEAAANMLHGSYSLSEVDGLTGGGLSLPKSTQHQVGTCINRWYDKLQLIVCQDGTAGVNFEHSSIDGQTALRLVSDIFADTVISFAHSITKTIYKDDAIPSILPAKISLVSKLAKKADGRPLVNTSPRRIVFDVPPGVVDMIFYAETSLGDKISSTDTVALEYKKYGKLFITSNKMSPDSFIQASVMLAYYRLYGKIVSAYEPVMTKRYLHGRTEAMRSATPAAATFCETWCSRFASPEDKVRALRDALGEHSRLVGEAARGMGVDRHLYALKCTAERRGMACPKFFESEPWRVLNHTVLSTSNCGNPSLRHFGFGSVVPDGFGVGYIIKDNSLHYSVSSKNRQTGRFVSVLACYLDEVHDILEDPLALAKLKVIEPIGRRNSMTNSIDSFAMEKSKSGSPTNGPTSAPLHYMDNFDTYGETSMSKGLR